MNLQQAIFERKAVVSILVQYRILARMIDKQILPIITGDFYFKLPNKKVNDTLGKQLLKICLAINRLPYEDRKILYDKYICIDIKTNVELFLDYSVSESTFYRELKKALIHFGQAYFKHYVEDISSQVNLI